MDVGAYRGDVVEECRDGEGSQVFFCFKLQEKCMARAPKVNFFRQPNLLEVFLQISLKMYL